MEIDTKTLRREMGGRDWHNGQLAAVSGISRNTIGDILRGEPTTTATLDQLAAALDMRALAVFVPNEAYAGQQIKIEIPGMTLTLTLQPHAPAAEASPLAAVA